MKKTSVFIRSYQRKPFVEKGSYVDDPKRTVEHSRGQYALVIPQSRITEGSYRSFQMLGENESICSGCGKRIKDENETIFDNYADPWCKNCYKKESPGDHRSGHYARKKLTVHVKGGTGPEGQHHDAYTKKVPDKGALGRPPVEDRWAQKAINADVHTGWKKNAKPHIRRAHLLASTRGASLKKRYLEAARRIGAIANISQDPATKKAGEVDKNYFLAKYGSRSGTYMTEKAFKELEEAMT